jgi:hypothetical protein
VRSVRITSLNTGKREAKSPEHDTAKHAPVLGPSMTGNPLAHHHDTHGAHPHGSEWTFLAVHVPLMCTFFLLSSIYFLYLFSLLHFFMFRIPRLCHYLYLFFSIHFCLIRIPRVCHITFSFTFISFFVFFYLLSFFVSSYLYLFVSSYLLSSLRLPLLLSVFNLFPTLFPTGPLPKEPPKVAPARGSVFQWGAVYEEEETESSESLAELAQEGEYACWIFSAV